MSATVQDMNIDLDFKVTYDGKIATFFPWLYEATSGTIQVEITIIDFTIILYSWSS